MYLYVSVFLWKGLTDVKWILLPSWAYISMSSYILISSHPHIIIFPCPHIIKSLHCDLFEDNPVGWSATDSATAALISHNISSSCFLYAYISMSSYILIYSHPQIIIFPCPQKHCDLFEDNPTGSSATDSAQLLWSPISSGYFFLLLVIFFQGRIPFR